MTPQPDPIREAVRATLAAAVDDAHVLYVTVRTKPPTVRELAHLAKVLPGVLAAAAALTHGTTERVIRVRHFWS